MKDRFFNVRNRAITKYCQAAFTGCKIAPSSLPVLFAQHAARQTAATCAHTEQGGHTEDEVALE